MKKVFFILFIVFLQLAAAGVSPGQTDKKTLSRKIMEKSGLNFQVRQIPLLYSSGLQQSKDKIPPEVFGVLERETVKVFDPEKILEEISRQVEKNLDLKSMQGVLVWLDSDLGQRITAIEKAATAPGGMQGIEEYASSLQPPPASKVRLDLVRRLIESTNPVEMDVDTEIIMTMAILMAIHSVLPEGERMDVNLVKKEIDQRRPMIAEGVRKRVIQSNLFVYRILKDEEFQRYVEFAESEIGRSYHRVTYEGFRAAMEKVSLGLGEALRGLLKKLPRKEEKGATGKIVLHLKNGRTLTWYNHTEQENRYCTQVSDGEFCINKKDVSSVETD